MFLNLRFRLNPPREGIAYIDNHSVETWLKSRARDGVIRSIESDIQFPRARIARIWRDVCSCGWDFSFQVWGWDLIFVNIFFEAYSDEQWHVDVDAGVKSGRAQIPTCRYCCTVSNLVANSKMTIGHYIDYPRIIAAHTNNSVRSYIRFGKGMGQRDGGERGW